MHTETNKLIAEFMNYPENGKNSQFYYAMKHCYDTDRMKYHESWDWLMPVVDKINTDTSGILHIDEDCVFLHSPKHSAVQFMKEEHGFIGMVYAAVVEYINYYNENPAA